MYFLQLNLNPFNYSATIHTFKMLDRKGWRCEFKTRISIPGRLNAATRCARKSINHSEFITNWDLHMNA